MIINQIYLVTRNARDKVQVVIAELDQNGSTFTIRRTTGQYQGKMTEQPLITIEKGKAKRSVIEQANLEFNSIINKYLDKGYKKLSDLTTMHLNAMHPDDLSEIVPSIKSDSNGNSKPMLAKDYNSCQNSVLDKPKRCSRKLNGVRCMMKWDTETNSVVAVSRGGKDYNCSTTKIREILYPYLRENPHIILDGELYKHGQYLQTISGIARKKTWDDRCDMLEYWIYDIADDKMVFEDRYNILETLRTEVFVDLPKIKVIEHFYTESWNEIKTLHDKWVAEGFEGLVARKLDKVYEFGKRSSTMIKVKDYKDGEFKIIDYKDGLREEDFCFICETSDGKLFSAKPIGDRELKTWYINNINDIIGLYGKVKYFELSKEGIPQQTIFQSVRYVEDIDEE